MTDKLDLSKNNALTTSLEGFKSIKELANEIVSSKLFSSSVSNVEEAIEAMMVGSEVGFSVAMSLKLGKMLNRKSLISILRGKELEIGTITSMNDIHVIEANGREIIYTGIHIITAVLIKAGVKIEILKDFAPLYQYTELSTEGSVIKRDTNKQVILLRTLKENELTDKHKIISETDMTFEAGRIPVFKHENPYDYITSVKLSRTFDKVLNEIPISYTLQDAIDAGLMKGISSTKEVIKGKDNWIKHTKTMLRNRAIAIAGRIIAADKLGSTYEYSEVVDVTNDPTYSDDEKIINISSTTIEEEGHN